MEKAQALAAMVRSESAKTIAGDFPPSSRVTDLRLEEAAAMATFRPVGPDPVKLFNKIRTALLDSKL